MTMSAHAGVLAVALEVLAVDERLDALLQVGTAPWGTSAG